MPNPEICDKCWEKYYNIPGNLIIHQGSPSCSKLRKWFCPKLYSEQRERVGEEDPPIEKCPKLFEHAVAAGMKHGK